MALPVYTDPNAGGVFDPVGADIQQQLLAEALRSQKKRQIAAQAQAYQPMGGQMVGTPRYQHYVPDYGAGFRGAANILGSNAEAKTAQSAFDIQAQAKAARDQAEFDKWKAQQPQPQPAMSTSSLPQTMGAIGGTPTPKEPGAGFQQTGYEPDAEASLPAVDMGIDEALADDEADVELEDAGEYADDTGDDYDDLADEDPQDVAESEPKEENDMSTPEGEDTAAVESTSVAQNVVASEPSMLRSAFESTITPSGGTPLATGRDNERAMWLLQGMRNFPKLSQALGHDYAATAAAGKRRAPINLGQGVLYDPNTGQYLASGDFAARTAKKSEIKKEEDYNRFLQQRELELTRQMGKAKTFEERAKFEALRAEIARERIISQEKIANIKSQAKTKAAGMIAGAIGGAKLPADTRKGIMTSRQNRRTAEEALAALEGNPDAVGWKGFTPQAWLNRMDPKGVEARAALADLGSMIVHDRSGAAVTAAEFPRLQPFIPGITDDYETAKKKLRRFVQVYKESEEQWEGIMGETFGGEAPRAKAKLPGASSSPTFKYDARGNPIK